jgi:acyl-CoA oxidase
LPLLQSLHVNQGRRFAATLGELTGGRVGLTCGSVGVLKGAVTIAIRYSAGRQQFGPPDSAEVRYYSCAAGLHLYDVI